MMLGMIVVLSTVTLFLMFLVIAHSGTPFALEFEPTHAATRRQTPDFTSQSMKKGTIPPWGMSNERQQVGDPIQLLMI
jgi:hypothetical protein